MVKSIVILLIFFISNCSSYIIQLKNFNYSSDIWYNLTFNNFGYDFLVLVGNLDNCIIINIDFMPTDHYMDVYYKFSKTYLDNLDVLSELIDTFDAMIARVYPGYHFSESYAIDPNYQYMYIAFHADGDGMVNFQFKTSYECPSTDDTTDDTSDDTTDDTTDDTPEKPKKEINKLVIPFIVTVSVLVIIIIILIIIIFKFKRNNDNQIAFSDDNKANEGGNLIMEKND